MIKLWLILTYYHGLFILTWTMSINNDTKYRNIHTLTLINISRPSYNMKDWIKILIFISVKWNIIPITMGDNSSPKKLANWVDTIIRKTNLVNISSCFVVYSTRVKMRKDILSRIYNTSYKMIMWTTGRPQK